VFFSCRMERNNIFSAIEKCSNCRVVGHLTSDNTSPASCSSELEFVFIKALTSFWSCSGLVGVVTTIGGCFSRRSWDLLAFLLLTPSVFVQTMAAA
jgi:hypothetical protein